MIIAAEPFCAMRQISSPRPDTLTFAFPHPASPLLHSILHHRFPDWISRTSASPIFRIACEHGIDRTMEPSCTERCSRVAASARELLFIERNVSSSKEY